MKTFDPGNPKKAKHPLEMIDCFGQILLLGVCLGHQCIGHYLGAEIVEGDSPVHRGTCLKKI